MAGFRPDAFCCIIITMTQPRVCDVYAAAWRQPAVGLSRRVHERDVLSFVCTGAKSSAAAVSAVCKSGEWLLAWAGAPPALCVGIKPVGISFQ